MRELRPIARRSRLLSAASEHRGVMRRIRALSWSILLCLSGLIGYSDAWPAEHIGLYTTDRDFDLGRSVNLIQDPGDQLQLEGRTQPFGFIWVAVSSKGTVIKMDTETGKVLGEYHTAPRGAGLNPSRTTVDKNGNVWVTNRDEAGMVGPDAIAPGLPAAARAMGSVVHIGLVENGQCVDRNANGTIDTSTGQGDVRPWSNQGGADSLGGVSTAADECIIHYTRVNSTGARHVSVTTDNAVWVSGTGGRYFDLLDGDSGRVIEQAGSVGYGGYGGLIDGNGVIWSANPFMRWDTRRPLSGPSGGNWQALGPSYGLCIDRRGFVWTSTGPDLYKYSPEGRQLGKFRHGGGNAQGCVVDQRDHVWVAHSLMSSSVGHVDNDGALIGVVEVGQGPTGVAVDRHGKVWSTNYNAMTVSRIDPDAGPLGPDGRTRVGAVDFTSGNLGGNLYNYSDMTGSTLHGAPDRGTWTIMHDSGQPGTDWELVHWNAAEEGGSHIRVTAASSDDGQAFGASAQLERPGRPDVGTGRYLRVEVGFVRGTRDRDGDGLGDSPVLYDIAIATAECIQDKACAAALAVAPKRKRRPADDIDSPRPEPPGGAIVLPDLAPLQLSPLTPDTVVEGRIDLSESRITGVIDISVSSDFDHPGSRLEIDFGQGWEHLDGKRTIRVADTAPPAWPVRVRSGNCPRALSPDRGFLLFIEALGGDGIAQRQAVPLNLRITGVPLLECWRPYLIGVILLLTAGIIAYGFWVPSRFSRTIALMFSPELDLSEGFPVRIRGCRGTGSGFYRDARAFLHENATVTGRRRGAFAQLHACGRAVEIRPLSSTTVEMLTPEDNWEPIPGRRTTMRFGSIYRTASGTLYFGLRNI
jgi:streptogramin lyase